MASLMKYKGYEPSEVVWIGYIPDYWKIKRLKDLVNPKITDGPHETPEFSRRSFITVGIELRPLIPHNVALKDVVENSVRFFKKRRCRALCSMSNRYAECRAGHSGHRALAHLLAANSNPIPKQAKEPIFRAIAP